MNSLTQGSVWRRVTAKPGAGLCTVIGVTNTHLDEKHQAKFPPQVLFMTAKGGGVINSMPVADFLSNREFHDVDTSAVTLIANLSNMYKAAEPAPNEEHAAPVVAQKFDKARLCIKHELEELLNTALVSYRETPDLSSGDTLHSLSFNADEIFFSDIIKVFHQKLETSVQDFTLQGTVDGETFVEINGYLGVYLEFDAATQTNLATVYLSSSNGFRQHLDEIETNRQTAEILAAKLAAQAAPIAQAAPVVQPMPASQSGIVHEVVMTEIPQTTEVPVFVKDAADDGFTIVEG